MPRSRFLKIPFKKNEFPLKLTELGEAAKGNETPLKPLEVQVRSSTCVGGVKRAVFVSC